MDRPYIHINCASSLDGKISLPNGGRLRISGEWDMRRVHRLRASMGSILVGAGTVIQDDPKFTVKEELARVKTDLLKIVIDGKGRIPSDARFLSTPGRSFIVTSESANPDWMAAMGEISTEKDDVELIVIPGVDGVIDLSDILSELKQRGVDSILVEGGSRMIWEFASIGLFDALTIYIAPILVGGNGPTVASGGGFPVDPPSFRLVNTVITEDGGILAEYSWKG